MSSLDELLAPFRIPLGDIAMATNDFAEENLLERDRKADVYKGLLLFQSKVWIDVAIWRFGHGNVNGFKREIRELCRVKHRNIVSLIGFCDEKGERMMVMEHVVNGSVDKYLSDPTTLTLSSQRLNICFGAALALEQIDRYIMKGAGLKILLDKDWEAKVLILIDFESENSHADYFDKMILKVLDDAILALRTYDVNQYQTLYQLGDISDSNLRKLMQLQSILETAYYGLKVLRQHTYMSHLSDDERKEKSPYRLYDIVYSLKKALRMQWEHENLLRVQEFEHLKIPFSHIKLATNDFANTIKSNIYDTVYKGHLLEKTVIIKLDRNGDKTVKHFYAEIDMLTSCKHKHPNLVPLLGFCDESSEIILVFECDFNETLHDYLRSTNKTNNLTWEQRIRICIDIAHGLTHLHTMKESHSMLHQGILSANVVLDDKWTAQLANFRLSKYNSYATCLWQSRPENFRTWLWDTDNAPWIPRNQRLVVDDVYCLGVILFEILTGRLAENVNELASMAQLHFNEGTLENMADPMIMEEVQECSYALKKGPDKYSFNTYTKIANQCLVEIPSKRPTLEAVVKSLEKALHFQVQNLELLKIPLNDIESVTENFHQKYLIGSGGYGLVYKAELYHFDIRSTYIANIEGEKELPKVRSVVAIKRILNREDDQGKAGFLAELDVLSKCEHPNIVSLFGFCIEDGEMLLVYEYASNGSLDDYLGSIDNMNNLMWAQRLKMCIDIAHGLNYLHTTMEDKDIRIIHRDIKSANILLGKNCEAKIADFGLSKFHPLNQHASTINTNVAGTIVYLDPEYARTRRLKKASDIYSFGVVLFEIFSGTLAYDSKYIWENSKGLAPIAQRNFEQGTLKEILDPKILDEAHELSSTLKVGPNRESLNIFSSIAYDCLAKTQAERPTIEVVLMELNKALLSQENRKDTFKIPLEDIRSGVGNFGNDNCISKGGCGAIYTGELQYNSVYRKVVVKRFSRSGQEHGLVREFEVLYKHKHNNIVGLVGYCKELEEKIIVYEHTSNGSLDKYLNDASLSWSTRLKICIDIANGLKFLHGGDVERDVVIHRDLKSSNVLLTEDWKAKICGFERSLAFPTDQEMKYVINDVIGSPGYCDPLYWETHTLTKESDIYSLGVILFEILCGRSACDFTAHVPYLDVLVKRQFEVARVDDIVFEGIKEEIVVKSLATFRRIAFQCLHEEREERPTADEVVKHLQKALEFQEPHETWETYDIWEDYEIWEAKLPRNQPRRPLNF